VSSNGSADEHEAETDERDGGRTGWCVATSLIVGPHGPLTSPSFGLASPISFDRNGRWNGTDTCNRLSRSYRLASGGIIHLEPGSYSDAPCGVTGPTPNLVLAAVRVELLNGRLMFFAHNGKQLAQYERATVTARVVLPSTTMTAGSSMSGHLIVENDTGHALQTRGCGPFFKSRARPRHGPTGCSVASVALRDGNPSGEVELPGSRVGQLPRMQRRSTSWRKPWDRTLPPEPRVHRHSLPASTKRNSSSRNVVPTPPPITVRVTRQRPTP
jgi:hypothetical protein